MHDEPTTMGGDHNWREQIRLSPEAKKQQADEEWRDRWIGPAIIALVVFIYYWVFRGLYELWRML